MTAVRKNDDEAERLYRQAIEIDPTNEHWKTVFDRFLQTRAKKKKPRSPRP